jgi:hypothetical protein
MPEQESQAARYRRFAAQCFEVARRMTPPTERERLTHMAEEWLDAAQKAEREESADWRRGIGNV